MLNKRQEMIIKILKEQKSEMTGKQLSSILHVSDRTIRSDIESINRSQGVLLIYANMHHGYKLDHRLLAQEEIIHHAFIPCTPSERCAYILQELLCKQQGVKISFLKEHMFISENSLENDMKKIKNMIKTYPSLQLKRSRNEIHLEGSEIIKRKLYKELLVAETKDNFLNLDKLASLYKDFDLLKVKGTLEAVFEEFDYHLHDIAFPMLMLHVGISMERIIHHNYAHTDRKSEDLLKSKEFQIAKEFYKRVSYYLPIQESDDEVVLLSILLLGKRSSNYTQYTKIEEKLSVSIEQLVNDIFQTIHSIFAIDFSEDEELKTGLLMHIHSLLERMIQEESLVNVYVEEIKRRYPLIFEMSVHVSQFIESKTNLYIKENEIGFIALHLGAAYDRLHQSDCFKCVAIYPKEAPISNILMKKIQDHFANRLEVIETFRVFEKLKVMKLSPDLILTTLPLQHDLDIITIEISLFMNHDDESKIAQALQRLQRKRFQLSFISRVTPLIEPNLFFKELDLDKPEEVINFLGEKLYERSYVNADFKDLVLQREQLSATSLSFGFAIPHAIETCANTSSISVALLKNPIMWGDYQVKLVMLLAFHENDRQTMRLFFDWLANAVNDTGAFASLLQSKSYEQFMMNLII